MKKHLISLMVLFLLVSTSFVGMSHKNQELCDSDTTLDVDLIYPYASHIPVDTITYVGETQADYDSPLETGMGEHQWPQQGLNCQHSGRSLFSTAENPGYEKWRFPATHYCDGSPVIDAEGTIYFGSLYLYAVHPNGTLKWTFKDTIGFANYGNHPGIAADGTIYAATRYGSDLCAVNPNGTKKWLCQTPEIDTSITVAEDGMLYYGHWQGLDARYPDGTLRWRFPCGGTQSTPAVDSNNIIYFGSIDAMTIYALYSNGTVKWSYTTDAWVHGSPTIAPDGTIYCGSDDDYLYAFYPNGTLKWKTYTGSGMRSSPSLDKNGNLYFGMYHSKIMSIAPDGTIRWTFPLPEGDRVWGSTAAISDDGTIYIGSSIHMDMNGGGEIIALGLDGTLKWRKTLCDCSLHSSPVISADGSVYICSSYAGQYGWGFLHAFNTLENNQPPETPTIDGPTQSQIKKSVMYTFQANDSDYTPVSFNIDWGDGTNTRTIDYQQGLLIRRYHTWAKQGTYTIRAKAIDSFGFESGWATLTVTMPFSYEPQFPFISWLLERFPNAFPLLRYLFGVGL